MFPSVSIIVPVYNCEKYIERCINSILNQTYTNIEVIIINDGSTDNSHKIVKNLIRIDNRIKYIEQENRGPSEARNKGIEKSTGDYLMFIDSDDSISDRYVEEMINIMLDKEYDIVCCGYKDISKYGIVNCNDFNMKDNLSLYDVIDMVCNGTGGVLWSKIFKKDIVIKQNIKLNKDIFMCEDLIFVLQYILHCKSFGFIDEHLYTYNRLNESSISSNISMNYIKNYIDLCKSIEDILRTINLNQDKIDEIITCRIQSVVISLLELQVSNIKKLGIRKCISNSKKIIHIDYVKLYKDKFITSNNLYKPYIFSIKYCNILAVIVYGIVLNIMKKIKRSICFNKGIEIEGM